MSGIIFKFSRSINSFGSYKEYPIFSIFPFCLNFNNFSTRFNFLEQKGDIETINFIENISTYVFNEENYLSFKTRRNKDLDLTEYYNLIYEYKNDCLVASIQYNKNYYNDGDIKPVEELFFTITIVPLTTFSPDKMVLK